MSNHHCMKLSVLRHVDPPKKCLHKNSEQKQDGETEKDSQSMGGSCHCSCLGCRLESKLILDATPLNQTKTSHPYRNTSRISIAIPCDPNLILSGGLATSHVGVSVPDSHRKFRGLDTHQPPTAATYTVRLLSLSLPKIPGAIPTAIHSERIPNTFLFLDSKLGVPNSIFCIHFQIDFVNQYWVEDKIESGSIQKKFKVAIAVKVFRNIS